MVGVAGKSQACHDCRRRRVKCDYQRPQCTRCVKSKITCKGYEKRLVLVNRSLAQPTTTAASVLSNLRRQDAIPALPSPSELEIEVQWLVSSSPSLPAATDTHSRRSRIIDMIKQLYLPDPHSMNIHTGYSWIHILPEMARTSDALDYSLVTFAITVAHCTSSSLASVEQALGFYTTALQALRIEIQDPWAKCLEELATAVILLNTCDVFLNKVDDSWKAHVGGLSDFFQWRGPLFTSNPVWHHLFVRFRTLSMLQGLMRRKDTILSQPEWREFAAADTCQSPFRLLHDILSEIPPFFEHSDNLGQENGALNQESILSLIQQGISLKRRLYSWFDRLRRDMLPDPVHWAVPCVLINPADKDDAIKTFPFALEFPNIDVALVVVLQWAVLVEINSCITRIKYLHEHLIGNVQGVTQNHPDSFDTDDLDLPSIEDESDRLARYISQSVQFFHKIEARVFGQQAITYQLWVARYHFQQRQARYGKEYAWHQGLGEIQGVGLKSGRRNMTYRDPRPIPFPTGCVRRTQLLYQSEQA